MVTMGFTLNHCPAIKAAANKSQLVRSTKLSGVTKMAAAAAIIPMTMGLSALRMDSKRLLSLNLV